MWVSLHVAEPSSIDPTATMVNTSGPTAVPVSWDVHGSVLSNRSEIVFQGVAPDSVVSWVAVSLDPDANRIAFYGDLADSVYGSGSWSSFTLGPNTIKLIIG
jgi:hypothetical protein